MKLWWNCQSEQFQFYVCARVYLNFYSSSCENVSCLFTFLGSLIYQIRLASFSCIWIFQMDVGVGSFVLANSLVSRQARNISSMWVTLCFIILDLLIKDSLCVYVQSGRLTSWWTNHMYSFQSYFSEEELILSIWTTQLGYKISISLMYLFSA